MNAFSSTSGRTSPRCLPWQCFEDLRGILAVIGALLVLAPATAVAQTEDGSITLQATVSGYVDLASGGPVTLVGGSGGTITGNPNKGDQLTGVTIDLGDVSPVNTTPFVKAIVPLRVRSNNNYVLSVSTTGFGNADPLAIQDSDVGFGIDNVSRADPGVISGAGVTDNPLPAALGDPSLDGDADPGTDRWDYATEKSLAYYTASRDVLSGPRIMSVVPGSALGGLTLDTFFVVKPQFFTPGAFSTTVTFTVATP